MVTESKQARMTVVVLGMHRSGTSVVAQLLHELGVAMGPPEMDLGLGQASLANVRGHYEDKQIVALQERILRSAGGSWLYPPEPAPLARAWQAHREEFHALLHSRNQGKFGWKDPRTVLLARHVIPELESPRAVICRRHPEAVVRSLSRRSQVPVSIARALLHRHDEELRSLSRDSLAPVLTIEYEELLRSPQSQIERLGQFVDCDPGPRDLERLTGLILGGPRMTRAKLEFVAHTLSRQPARVWKGLMRRLF